MDAADLAAQPPQPAVAGAWSWLSDRTVHYRPQAYWPARTHVVVDVDVKDGKRGAEWLGRHAAAISGTRTHRTASGGLHAEVPAAGGAVPLDVP